MSTPALDYVQTARHRFFDRGDVPGGLVSETILRSWQRCVGLGLSADTRPAVEPLTAQALREVCQQHEELRRICLPGVRALYTDAHATGSIVILAAPDGMILESLGSADFLGKAARVALRSGVPWSENHTGTNAIGTAITEGRAVEVRGPEHFFAAHRVLSCSAVPIIDPFGKIAGVFDLSGESSVHHTHALGMVRVAVDQIERRLFERDFSGCRMLRIQRDAGLFGTPLEGVLVFEGERLVAANRHGLSMLKLGRDDIGRKRFGELFDARFESLRGPMSVRDHLHKPIFVRAEEESSKRGTVAVSHTVAAVPDRYPDRRAATEPVFSTDLKAALGRAERVLGAGMSVLLLGETGTGKEVFARELHRRIGGDRMPFVAVNCAGLPESLIESELFGYEEGAFTGAKRHGNKGLLREADGGVLFLDEIGDMPPAAQTRLLRVLQEREVVPLGGGKPMKVDFAVIAATHRDLKVGGLEQFRSDLFFRIAHYTIHLPPLREYPDRRALIETFWNRLAADTTTRLGGDAFDVLVRYDWPGNLRQLTGTLRTLIALAGPDGTVHVEELPAMLHAQGSPPNSGWPLTTHAAAALSDITERAMRQALEEHAGNVSAAARSLGVSRSTLYRRLNKAS
ncbi:MAG: sigma-54-dependent Fis family transcriptional regulator [Rhodanobacter sp.]|jgi:transcriptional regulator of acetoin/glycerol metabolism|nr:sigma-54-dependent Fis family transcriptional regulator [Rhodanobacter sp.]